MGVSWLERANRALLSNYFPASLILVRGEGCRVFDDSGQSYLDLVSGISVNNLGHCHPAVVAAIREQCATLMHVSNLYQHQLQVLLAERLAEEFPGGRSFFCNSGAEANEAAIKLVRKCSVQRHGEARHVIVAAENSFHGRTVAALSATGQKKYQEGFGPMVPGFRHVPFDDLSALDKALTEDVCAVMLEPLQGEGGVIVPSGGYLTGAAELCRARDILLVFDEVQTGMGRTGHFFAHQEEGVVPDVLTLSKSLGGGLPLGAMMARGEAAAAFEPGNHATTFGGNPVACAAALAAIETLKGERIIENARETGAFFRSGLEELARRAPVITEVRGKGLLLAAELSVDAKPLAAAAQEKGFLINPVQEKVLRFAPPLIIGREDISLFLEAFEGIISGVA